MMVRKLIKRKNLTSADDLWTSAGELKAELTLKHMFELEVCQPTQFSAQKYRFQGISKFCEKICKFPTTVKKSENIIFPTGSPCCCDE